MTENKIFLVKTGSRMTEDEFWQEGFWKAKELSPQEVELLKDDIKDAIDEIETQFKEQSWGFSGIQDRKNLLKKLEALK